MSAPRRGLMDVKGCSILRFLVGRSVSKVDALHLSIGKNLARSFQLLLPQNQIRPLPNLSIQPLCPIVEILRMPIKLIRPFLLRLLRHKINQLLPNPARPTGWVDEQIVQVKIGLCRRRGRVRVVVGESDGFAVVSECGDGAVDGVCRVEEALEGGFGGV